MRPRTDHTCQVHEPGARACYGTINRAILYSGFEFHLDDPRRLCKPCRLTESPDCGCSNCRVDRTGSYYR